MLRAGQDRPTAPSLLVRYAWDLEKLVASIRAGIDRVCTWLSISSGLIHQELCNSASYCCSVSPFALLVHVASLPSPFCLNSCCWVEQKMLGCAFSPLLLLTTLSHNAACPLSCLGVEPAWSYQEAWAHIASLGPGAVFIIWLHREC